MSTFYDFTKTMYSALKDYYTYNTTPAIFFETDDCIYLSGIPCDKYTLAPITFYKDKPMTSLNGMGLVLAPFTTTRCYNRLFGDMNKQPYRIPYGPNQTMLKNNVRLSTGDEAILTPSVTTAHTTPTSYRGNSVIVINKTTNKIANVLYDDLGNIKSGICLLDDNRYLVPKNVMYGNADTSQTGRMDSYFTVFNKLTNSEPPITFNNYGYIHNIIGTTLAGELLVLNTVDSGSNASLISTFAVSKLNKSTLVSTNAITTQLCPTTASTMNSGVPMEPAITLDCKTIYFPVMNTVTGVVNGPGGKATYTINKYSVDIPNGVVTNVAQTINLNGLATSLNAIFNANSASYRGGPGSNIVMTYLEVGGNKYLVATNTINSQDVWTYSPIAVANFPTSAQYAMMYLFQISGDTLNLVDVRSLMGGASDPVQVVFPVNNNKNLLVVRNNGLDVLAIDSVANKFITQNTVGEPIYACGIDELERIWYLTSNDTLNNDGKLKVFSVGALVVIKTDFQNTNVNYAGTSIINTLNVSVSDNTGVLMATSVQILIEGNAMFTSTGTKSMTVTTNATAVVPIQVTITGDGMINLYSNINIGS